MSESATVSREVVVLNDAGMHLRPAANFVQVANKYKNCEVRVFKGNPNTDSVYEGPVNGKSIMGLIMLTAQKGTKLFIECKGENAQQALDDLCQLVNSRFGMDT